MAMTASLIARPQPAVARLKVKNKDPNYHYRWINTREDGRVEFRKEQGYEFVNKEGEGIAAGDEGIPGSVCRAGSMVLMRCPKKIYKQRVKAKQIYTRKFTNRSIDEFKSKAAAMGIEVVDEVRESRGPINTGEE